MDDWIGDMLSDFDTKKVTKFSHETLLEQGEKEMHEPNDCFNKAINTFTKALSDTSGSDPTILDKIRYQKATCHYHLRHYGSVLRELSNIVKPGDDLVALIGELRVKTFLTIGCLQLAEAELTPSQPQEQESTLDYLKQCKAAPEELLPDKWETYIQLVRDYCERDDCTRSHFLKSLHSDLTWCDHHHPSLEVRITEDNRGRGLFVTDDIPEGTLLIAEKAFAIGNTTDALIRMTMNQFQHETVERQQTVLQMFNGKNKDELPTYIELSREHASVSTPNDGTELKLSWETAEKIIGYNHHQLDAPTIDTLFVPVVGTDTTTTLCSQAETTFKNKFPNVVGLWPYSSLINHNVTPNVHRLYLGDIAVYRTIAAIKKDEEVVDNYLDVRMCLEERNARLHGAHKFTEEKDSNIDLDITNVKKMRALHSLTTQLIRDGDTEKALVVFQENWEWISEQKDACLVDICLAYSAITCTLHDYADSVDILLTGLAFCTIREPYSVLSTVLTSRICESALLDPSKLVDELKEIVAMCVLHYDVVFGKTNKANQYTVELFNPTLAPKMKLYLPNSNVFR